VAFAHLIAGADPGSVERGADYYRRSLVTIIAAEPHHATAVVKGTIEYDVRLDGSSAECTCPVGLRGMVCKHVVATILTLDSDLAPPERESPSSPRARKAPFTGDVTDLKPSVESLRVRGYLEWRRANDHGERAHEVVDRLEEALSPATADDLRGLIERAIDVMIRAIHRSDDSSGIQSQATGRLLDLHVQAARLGSPDQIRLARWMAKLDFADNGWVQVDPVDYAAALGDRGMKAFRKEVDKRLVADPDDFHPRRAQQRLAVFDRDIPRMVELIGGPLDRPYYYQELVDALLEIGAVDEALAYALRGITVSPVHHQTVPLYDTAVRLLHERGELEDALELRRSQLETFPIVASYGALRQAALDLDRWPTERLSGLDILLERSPRDWLTVLLSEGEIDLAWDASRSMDLDPTLTLLVLRAHAKTHPMDVLDGYTALVHETLRQADQQNYRQAVAHLGELRRASIAAGREADYDALVAELLETHKRRPTLVAMLRRMPSR
jgi:uncharacterized Zn finger protein